MSEQHKSNTSYRFPVIVGLVAFALGIFGSLLAAWIQQVWFGNAFTPERVAVILGLAALGLLAGAWLELRGRRETRPQIDERAARDQRNRQIMLGKVKDDWIKDYLEPERLSVLEEGQPEVK